MFNSQLKETFYYRFSVNFLIICFIATSIIAPNRAWAQSPADLNLPIPGSMVNISSAYVPVLVKGLRVHPENPILFDFIVDTGNSKLATNSTELKNESQKLINYFLASLTIPENDLWVNLSPYEKNRIVPEQLGQTEMGRDMLAEDYILKQLTASLIYPEHSLGKEFWNKVYSKAQQQYGSTEVPVNTFNKVWIMADKAKVYVHNNTAFVVASHLKVMLEEDYLSLTKHQGQPGDMLNNKVTKNVSPSTLPSDLGLNSKAPQVNPQATNTIASQIIKSIILPQLEQEVNTGKNFANLRQIFNSMILAAWYKKNLKESLLNQVYSNKAKTNGIEVPDKTIKEQIYQQYLKAYKKGVFNYIKEDTIFPPPGGEGQGGGEIIRKYFSGGVLGVGANIEQEVGTNDPDFAMFSANPVTGNLVEVEAQTPESKSDEAMTAAEKQANVDRLNSSRPLYYPERSLVKPPHYTNLKLLANVYSRANLNGYAHPDIDVLRDFLNAPGLTQTQKVSIRAQIKKLQYRIRQEIGRFADWTKFVDGMPRNTEETGMNGRGDLGRYGPNPSETAVPMRRGEKGNIEVLVKERLDGGGVELAGMFVPIGQEGTKFFGTTATKALKRELGLDVDMTQGIRVFEGQAGDWRDTNDAWVLDRAIAKLFSYEQSLYLKPEALEGTKEGSVRWVSVDDLDKLGFFASHRKIIEAALAMVKDGRIKTAEETVVSKFSRLNIQTTQIQKAFQDFKEGKTEIVRTYDVVIPQAPHGGNYLVAAGIEPLLNDIRRIRFTPDHIRELEATGRFDSDVGRRFLKYMSEFRYQGSIDALEEGRVVQEGIPVMRVRATEVEMDLLSDLLRNRLGQASLIATKTARISQAANGNFVSEEAIERLIKDKEQHLTREQIIRNRDVIDMSLRRSQGDGGFLASRATIIGGAIGTSNEQTAMEFKVDDIGSMAHAYMQAFGPKRQKEGFREWARAYPKTAIFLPDTFGDTLQGIRDAIEVAKEMETWGIDARLYGIRLDSGDLVKLSQQAREMLDEAGLHYVKIVASNDLDEYKITQLLEQGARIDVFGVGTSMGTGGEQATLNVEIRPSDNKRYWRSTINHKTARYITTPEGRMASADRKLNEEINELLVPYWENGRRVHVIELPWSGHERAMGEFNRLDVLQKKLNKGTLLPVLHQNNKLTIIKGKNLLLLIDLQKAFQEGGGLPVAGGKDIEKHIRAVMSRYDAEDSYASLDVHERGHISWASSYIGLPAYSDLTYDMVKDWTEENNKIAPHARFTLAELKEYLKAANGQKQTLWPEHADERLAESKLPEFLNEKDFKYILIKGMKPNVDSYSPLEDNIRAATDLAEKMRKDHPEADTIDVGGGLALDYCLGFGALGARKAGFKVRIYLSSTRSVGLPPGNVEAMLARLKEAGVEIIDDTEEFLAANNNVGVYPATTVKEYYNHPALYDPEESTSFVMDKYHMTMANIFVKLGIDQLPATFDYFFRKAPHGSDRIVLSGLRILAERLRQFKFTHEQIDFLRRRGIYGEKTLKFLENFRFTGNIMTLREGSIGFANEPLFKYTGTLLEGLIIEALVLNKLNFNSLIATLANLKRLDAGDMARLKEEGLAGAQGESHAEASLSAIHGGFDATTNWDAVLNYGAPSAWSNDEGVEFGAELVTGGENSALGGVWKVTDIDGAARIKVGEAGSGKATRPGRKSIVDVENEQGQVIDRINYLDGEPLAVEGGEHLVNPYVPFMTEGQIVFKAEGPLEVSAWRAEQNIRYANIHESRMSPGLKLLQQQLIAEAQAAVHADKALISTNGGIDLNANNMELTETGEKLNIHFDNAMLQQFKQGDFSGITPVIIRISPLSTKMSQLLGI